MLFNSYEFILLFLPLTIIVFYSMFYFMKNLFGVDLGKKCAIIWLVFMSLFFYAWWDYRYVPLLLGSITFNYFIGDKIEKLRSKKLLALAISVNVILLGYYKYTGFFIENCNALLGMEYDIPNIILPLGISFFMFTQTAYLIEIYRGETKNCGFLTYCEFVTIFPHLIAGPIIKHKDMLPQFISDKTFIVDYKNISMGLFLFTLGLGKKVLIADNISEVVSNIFSRADSLTFLEAWIGAIGYTYQLYFDFSGYSEMAIGLGLLFNMQFPVNFNSPYQARSIIDFWRRWHMTLGDWVKNYLYIPLGGNRCGEITKMRNLFFSMAIIGLWHGAGWNFIIWGCLHGLFLVINHQWRRMNIKLHDYANWGLTFLCVVVCWVFFRAADVNSALLVLSSMIDIFNIGLPNGGYIYTHFGFLDNYGVTFSNWTLPLSLPVSFGCLTILTAVLMFCDNPYICLQNYQLTENNCRYIGIILGILLGITMIMIGQNQSEFLYFQF